MSLTKFEVDVHVISGLEDSPNLTAAELKAKFDSAGAAIKEYINDTLTDQLDESLKSLEEKTEKIPAVVDSLTSSDSSAALSAAQGRALASQVQSLDQAKQNKISIGTSAPSGGSDGDLYIWY